MFEPIEVPYMQFHQKYKIIGECEYYGIYKGILHRNDPIQYLIFEHVMNETSQVYVPSTLFVSTLHFFEFVSQKEKIQSDMEMRALNLLVRRIIGDDHFEW